MRCTRCHGRMEVIGAKLYDEQALIYFYCEICDVVEYVRKTATLRERNEEEENLRAASDWLRRHQRERQIPRPQREEEELSIERLEEIVSEARSTAGSMSRN